MFIIHKNFQNNLHETRESTREISKHIKTRASSYKQQQFYSTHNSNPFFVEQKNLFCITEVHKKNSIQSKRHELDFDSDSLFYIYWIRETNILVFIFHCTNISLLKSFNIHILFWFFFFANVYAQTCLTYIWSKIKGKNDI